ncbi:hypothetical protein P5706_15610 [Pseudomonas sp. ChxA]|uniref:phage protein n=1 Tax=Pseudomonas sp. ChxA TaxID=3035473 RepID=UPI00255412F6|nr:hypothetical protein [Pseudomonas sp. ChxA]MDL2185611.1 hypothetical protein [Pseudomonas sp. ChxA]
MQQKNRIYSLTLGNTETGEGVEINNLQVRFNVSKSADNKKKPSSATVEVYNLSHNTLNLLSDKFVSCILKVGYESSGLVAILTGNVKELQTTQQGTDRVTVLQLGEAFSKLNHQKINTIVPPGATVNDVIDTVRKYMPEVARGNYTGGKLNSPLPYGYSLNGTPRELLTKLCKEKRMEWRVDGDALYVCDENGLVSTETQSAPHISAATGMVGVPYRASEPATKLPKDKSARKGLKVTTLLNPNIVPGKIVHVDSPDVKGWYRVNDVTFVGDFRGNDWYSDCFCTFLSESEAELLPVAT